jgi:ABC-type transport system involved in multi-copper enzyme maturation permease subunit
MVSRSLEKMMLIAVGLSTAVIIGVPVLLYAINTMTYSTHLQDAQLAADGILHATGQLDTGELNTTTIRVHIPTGMSMVADGSSLTISVLINSQTTSWSDSYSHQIVVALSVQHNVFNQATSSRVISPHDEE